MNPITIFIWVIIIVPSAAAMDSNGAAAIRRQMMQHVKGQAVGIHMPIMTDTHDFIILFGRSYRRNAT
ncbi:MAG TPA: hypothetical protein VHB54_18330 [Mucilaginibacter sp.]|nr:hypothetical protein [Mucilaginibacter sp.]